jgi:hypothetical protein
MERADALQSFLDAAFVAFDRYATDSHARASMARIFARLQVPAAAGTTPAKRLPVCERFLEPALEGAVAEAGLAILLDAFRSIEPSLAWRPRLNYDGSASANFPTGHANAMIVGPDGVENRTDLWLGVSLLAPHVRYPDHRHPPEETYLVLSEGEFQHGDSDWFAPGIGGSFYNPPGIRHAMRSGEKPLLALWALLPEGTGE